MLSDTELTALAYHRIDAYATVPKGAVVNFIVGDQLLWGALYKVPLDGADVGQLRQVPVRDVRQIGVVLFPEGCSYLDMDRCGNVVEHRLEGAGLRIWVGTGEKTRRRQQ